MSTFVNSDITNAGRSLIAKSFLGERIHFTRIAMGDGYLPPGTPIREMTDVINHVTDIDITRITINSDTTVNVGGLFSNANITEAFFYRELALFAMGDDETEIMYCYGNAGDFAEKITPIGGSSIIDKAIDIVTVIGTTENITADIRRQTTADDVSYNDETSQIGAETVQQALDLLARREDGTSSFYAHINNSDPHTTAAWKTNIQNAISELIAFSQRDIFVSPEERAAWNQAVLDALAALALAGTNAGDITDINGRVTQIEDSLFNGITANPFVVNFDSLEGLNVIRGVWNEAARRVEC